ncbi:DNA primase regulatory subunit PriL [Halocalculus aciditolerans]|uniref:DNA primase large subunit PriL n=1 Tax=Halocalculus aciditolerans TaxID=1383812 RepID=A0A830F7D3_9EURY|nr:DNA primase regulatory subunit PriL [Halocalculus aciditolerans]GGL46318.1 DNA primase [Halocalculus aciditolerans]
MEARHARYPFRQEAREAVSAAGVDLVELVRDDDAVVERAAERVTNAVTERDIGDAHPDDRVELLSYPVARVLVSIVDEHVLVRRYAAAEAQAAFDRFDADLRASDTELKSVSGPDITVEEFLAEFGLDAQVRETADGYDVGVGAYLPLSASLKDEQWRLVHRALDGGDVPVSETELHHLLQQAVEDRVADGLPLTVPDEITDELGPQVGEIRGVLDDLDLTRDIDIVVPELFPPCMKNLLERVRAGDHLPHHSRFAITAFLGNIGLETDEIVDLYEVNPGFGEEMTRYQTDHIKGETSPTEYTAPACATMKSYGDCVNPDALCEHISHPLSYYEAKIDDADEEEAIDWRERDDGDDAEPDESEEGA